MVRQASHPSGARSRRFRDQAWLVDGAIRQLGVDWDQGRSRYLAQACGPDAEADFALVRDRVRKFADIHRAFAAAATRRERLADEAASQGRTVSEREHAFTAAVLWGAAQWPLFANSTLNLAYGERKVACYQRFAAVAPHPVRRLEIAFGPGTLPAWLHLPVVGTPPWPCVIAVGGMDSFKEHLVALYGDKYLERGIARLTFDGPGQGELLTRGLWVTGTNFVEGGRAVLDWAAGCPELDAARIGVSGVSFGSFWATQIAGAVDGLAACATTMVIHEPGLATIFESASPTFKSRFMYMTGLGDEAEFDRFVRTLDLGASAPGIRCPYLVVAGEDDDLSPIEHTWNLLASIAAPRHLVLYQGERHGIGGGPAAALGPGREELVADWFADRFAGRPMDDRLLYVDSAGRVHAGPLFAEPPTGEIVAGRAPRRPSP